MTKKYTHIVRNYYGEGKNVSYIVGKKRCPYLGKNMTWWFELKKSVSLFGIVDPLIY